MKVFEVLIDDPREKEIKRIVEYVSADNINQVFEELGPEIESLKQELIGIREVLTISRRCGA